MIAFVVDIQKMAGKLDVCMMSYGLYNSAKLQQGLPLQLSFGLRHVTYQWKICLELNLQLVL